MIKSILIHRGNQTRKVAIPHVIVTRDERTFQTYEAWRRAVKAIDPNARIEGDKDIADAAGIGEWDGARGIIYDTAKAKNRDAATIGSTIRFKPYASSSAPVLKGEVVALPGNGARIQVKGEDGRTYLLTERDLVKDSDPFSTPEGDKWIGRQVNFNVNSPSGRQKMTGTVKWIHTASGKYEVKGQNGGYYKLSPSEWTVV